MSEVTGVARGDRAYSLVAGDVEGHGPQNQLWAHALHSAPYGQVKLPAVGKPGGGAQVCQGLQGLGNTLARKL